MNLNGGCIMSNKKSKRDKFPVGLRVLIVDDDQTCLTKLEKMLHKCRYQVTKTSRAEVALALLRENRCGFDIVISEVHMPDMDGFKLLEHVGLEMDLPVIMMSVDDSKHVVMKGVTHGACDYLIKPIRIKALKNIWQHVVRKRKNEYKDVEHSRSWDEGDRQQKQVEVVASHANEGTWKNSKRKSDEEEATKGKDDNPMRKKPRFVWSDELHEQFMGAVSQLGIEKAVPTRILELMNVPGLTKANVSSHLQKYRLSLKRLSGESQHQGGINNPSISQDPGFSSMSSLGGVDLQTLAATGQISGQALAANTRLPPAIKPGMSMPFVDQGNLFSYENNKLSYGESQQSQITNASKQMNLQQKSQEWQQLQNPNMSIAGPFRHGSSLPSSVNVVPLVMVNQSYMHSQKNEQSENSIAGKPMFSASLENQQGGSHNSNQNLSSLLVNHSSRVNPRDNLLSEPDVQNDFLIALLNQQEGSGSGYFDYDGYTLDHILV